MIPYGRQDISESDAQAVLEVLRSDFLTQGPAVPVFEEAVATFCGVKHGVAVNSATSALHLACLALGLGPGDVLWTSPITFVASANCALYCGASVDFVDVHPRTYNMSVEALAAKLERAKQKGRLPKIVMPVHLTGQSADMKAIHELSQRYGFRIVEDASHAIGGAYEGRPVGDCRYSDIAVFSFHPVKIITTAEGGMAMTNDDHLATRLRLLRTHGITRDETAMNRKPDGPWYYEQIALGLNYRLTDLQAALGSSQMKRLTEFTQKRHAIARRYDAELASLPVVLPWQDPASYSAYHLYVIRVPLGPGRRTRREVFDHIRAEGIGVNVHYIPVYHQPYYQSLEMKFEECPHADAYYSEAISIPMYSALTDEDQARTVGVLRDALDGGE